jgi:hypothetical protein
VADHIALTISGTRILSYHFCRQWTCYQPLQEDAAAVIRMIRVGPSRTITFGVCADLQSMLDSISGSALKIILPMIYERMDHMIDTAPTKLLVSAVDTVHVSIECLHRYKQVCPVRVNLLLLKSGTW